MLNLLDELLDLPWQCRLIRTMASETRRLPRRRPLASGTLTVRRHADRLADDRDPQECRFLMRFWWQMLMS
ncbi:hypothetical protein [Streptomyces sp. SAS_272]|uniref:hypothetical protein n=1 Tax=Streptomyces sp. SAS_272 TaxID=3412747 RepID=UPI00403CD1F5